MGLLFEDTINGLCDVFDVTPETFSTILNEEIDEYGVDLESGEGYTVYQCTQTANIPTIIKNGYSREFSNAKAYCSGLYTTFDERSSWNNLKKGIYGKTICKLKVSTFDHFVIFSKRMAEKVYGNTGWPLEKQFENYFPELWKSLSEHQRYRVLDVNTNHRDVGTFQNSGNVITSDQAHALCNIFGGGTLSDSDAPCDKWLSRFNVKGLIFDGPYDGAVAIIRDFSTARLVAYCSTDRDNRWHRVDYSDEQKEQFKNEIDPQTFLDGYSEYSVDFRVDRFTNGFIRIRRKADHMFNYMDKEHNIASPNLWFNNASIHVAKNGAAMVTFNLNGEETHGYLDCDNGIVYRDEKLKNVYTELYQKQHVDDEIEDDD